MFNRADLQRTSARTAGVVLGSLALTGVGITGAALAASGSGGLSTAGPSETADGKFPVRAKHTYGDGLGAGRGHQGQDIMAPCGKPVVAAQPGRVEYRAYQASGAGNYVVVDGRRKLHDTVYMHLARRASARKGQLVDAGDVIGRVGSTGRSSACHLHFEMWARGWSAGKPIDPKPYLERWERKS